MALCRGNCEIVERFLLILGERHVAGQPQHLKQLHRLVVYVGENNQGPAFLRNIDDAEKDRDADTVNQLGVAEVDDQRTAPGIELLLTFPLDPFAGKFVEIVARVHYGCSTYRV
jgi:hypothetical protein